MMPQDLPKTICHSPTPGKKPTAIPTWKYECLRNAILKIVPSSEPGLAAKDLPDAIRDKLRPEELNKLGSVRWHTTTVRLNMEVGGELQRVLGRKPLHVIRAV